VSSKLLDSLSPDPFLEINENPTSQMKSLQTAPEYILDESSPSPANDLYSLGCILHSIHLRTGPPFANHNTLSTARSNIESSLSLLTSQWRKLPQDTQQVLNSLITRYPNRRMTAKQFLESSYFQGVLVGTLRFLERDSFNSKSGEAQTGFLKGLITVRSSLSLPLL